MAHYGAIWDVDGTMVDTAEEHFAAWTELAREIGRPFSRADFNATFGQRNPEIIRRVFDAAADDATVADWGRRKEIMYRRAAQEHGVRLLPGVRELLERLAADGWRQAVGSSAPRENLELILRLTETRHFFHAIVSSEDTTRGKPDPQVFLIAAERLGLPPGGCVVFEDAVAGVEAAKAGGMKAVAVRTGGGHPEDKLRAAGADLVVESLAALQPARIEQLMELPENEHI